MWSVYKGLSEKGPLLFSNYDTIGVYDNVFKDKVGHTVNKVPSINSDLVQVHKIPQEVVKSDKRIMKPQRNIQWAIQNLLSIHSGLLSDQAEFETSPPEGQATALSTFESKTLAEHIYMILQLLQTSFCQINDSRVQTIKDAMIKNPLFQKMVSFLWQNYNSLK